MTGRLRVRHAEAVLIALVGLPLAALQPAFATAVGDCNGNGTVAINEVVRCVQISLNNLPLSACPNCDGNGDGTVVITDLMQAAACFSNPAACPMVTPPAGPTSTNTPVPSNTAVPPTDTPVPPAATATDTPTPTDTPAPPTNTPAVPTATMAAGLGDRTYTLGSASGFFSSFLPLSSVGSPKGAFVISAGAPDANGQAAVTVTGPAFITTVLAAGGVTLCTEVESCTGTLYCNGGPNVDVTETLDSLKMGLTCMQNTTNCPNKPTSTCCSNACDGGNSGNPTVGKIGVNSTNSVAGALVMTCTQRSLSVNKTSGVNCTTQDYSTAGDGTEIYTTGSNTAVVTNHCAGTLAGNNATTVPMFSKTGQAFSCTNWTSATGPGSLAFSIPTEEPTTIFPGDGSQAAIWAGH